MVTIVDIDVETKRGIFVHIPEVIAQALDSHCNGRRFKGRYVADALALALHADGVIGANVLEALGVETTGQK